MNKNKVYLFIPYSIFKCVYFKVNKSKKQKKIT